MRRVFMIVILLGMVPLAFASGDDVLYAGGTVPQLKIGDSGRLDFSLSTRLQFVSSRGTLEVPYCGIESFEHTKEVAVHLGVAPAIAVGLVAARKRNHFVRITYLDCNQVAQVVVFQVPQNMPAFLIPALEARAPQAYCGPYSECGPMRRVEGSRSRPQGAKANPVSPSSSPTITK